MNETISPAPAPLKLRVMRRWKWRGDSCLMRQRRTLEGEGGHSERVKGLGNTRTQSLGWRSCFLLSYSFHVGGAHLLYLLASLSTFTLSTPDKGYRLLQLVLLGELMRHTCSPSTCFFPLLRVRQIAESPRCLLLLCDTHHTQAGPPSSSPWTQPDSLCYLWWCGV